MASDDFNEAKYTEAAWSLISSLTKVADFYETTSVEAPLLLDLMLNPSKHNAGESAESAKRVVEKILTKANVNVSDLRSDLEVHLSKQARIRDSNSMIMGRSLQKVLDTARIGQSILGVSLMSNYLSS
jgi:ATP-dependent Clp protease ATP-binding subunit ClpB